MFYLAFSYTDNLYNKAIRFCTMSTYCHVDIFYCDDTNRLDDGIVYMLSATTNGVLLTTLRDRWADSDRVYIYRIDHPNFNSDMKEQYRNLIPQFLNHKYDYLAILGFIFRRNWKDSNRWICSELIAHVCNQLGIPLLANIYDESVLSPRDISLSPYLTRIT